MCEIDGWMRLMDGREGGCDVMDGWIGRYDTIGYDTIG